MNFVVGILGASPHTGNRGVSALGASLAKLILRAKPRSTLAFLAGTRVAQDKTIRVEGRAETVSTINYRLSPSAALSQQMWWILLLSLCYRIVPSRSIRNLIARRSRWIGFLERADFVGDIRGGDSFSDIYGVRRFLLGSLPVLSALLVRGRIHLLPQTYGPFRSPFARSLARVILLRSESIWCRDRASLREVTEICSGRRSGRLCPDVAFALEPMQPQSLSIIPPLAEQDHSILIGINVNGLMYNDGQSQARSFGLSLDYKEFLELLVARLLDVDGAHVLLVPHEYAPDHSIGSDPAACRAVRDTVPEQLRDRVHLVAAEYDQHEIKWIIGRCDFFIGSRMHACIAALSQGVPTVAVAYSRKFTGVFDTVGAAELVVDARTETVQTALQKVEQMFVARHALQSSLSARIAGVERHLTELVGSMIRSGAEQPTASMHTSPQ